MSLNDAMELVGSLSEIVLAPSGQSSACPLLIQRLMDFVDFDCGYIATSSGSSADAQGAVVGHDAVALRRDLGRYLGEISPREVALYTDHARVHHEVWPSARQAQLSVFRELHRPNHVKHMIVRVSMRRGKVAGFNLERTSTMPFTYDELRMVELAAPFLHIVAALGVVAGAALSANELAHEYHLTPRESEVADFAIRGLQNGEIASLVKISVNTVRNTLVRVFDKVGVSNRSELAFRLSQPRDRQCRPCAEKSDSGLLCFISRVENASYQANNPSYEQTHKRACSRVVPA